MRKPPSVRHGPGQGTFRYQQRQDAKRAVLVVPLLKLREQARATPEGSYLGACADVVASCLLKFMHISNKSSATDRAHLATAVEKTVVHWTDLSKDCAEGLPGCFKFMKYKLTSFASFLLEADMPDRPFRTPTTTDNVSLLLCGRFARYAKSLLRRPFLVRLSLAASVLQLKKGFPRPDKAMLEDAELQTFVELTTRRQEPAVSGIFSSTSAFGKDLFQNQRKWENDEEDPLDAEGNLDKKALAERVPWYFDQKVIETEIDRAVNEIFSPNSYTLADRLSPFFPSTSANYIRSRTGMGAIGAIFEDYPELLEGLRTPGGGVVVEDALNHEQRRPSGLDPDFRLDSADLDKSFGIFYLRLIRLALVEKPLAEPLALAEALKTRVITKGPPLLNTTMKPLQRFLWKQLRRHRVFHLIGSPVDERFLFTTFGKLAPGKKFLSGDYKNATNELKSWVSEKIAKSVALRIGLSADETELFVRSLTQHVLVHGKKEAKQVNGQLMGSVTSFPVLCIANFVICRLAMEMSAGHRMPLSTVPLLVNGDDCLFVTDEEGRRLWSALGKFVGLSPSIGKVFWSDRFANINSTMFSYDELNPFEQAFVRNGDVLEPRGPEPGQVFELIATPYRLVKYINYGLMKGLKRSGGKVGRLDAVDPMNSIGARHRELFRLCPEELWAAVNDEFMDEHREVLHETRLPWYLPETLGGVGLVGVASTTDCKLAIGILRNWSELETRPMPIKEDTPWKVRQCAQQMLQGLPERSLSHEEAKASKAVFGRLCVATLFDSRVDLSQLYCSETDTKRDVLKHNINFWKQARLNQSLYHPLPSLDELRAKGEEILDGQTPESVTTNRLFSTATPAFGVSFTPVQFVTDKAEQGQSNQDLFLQVRKTLVDVELELLQEERSKMLRQQAEVWEMLIPKPDVVTRIPLKPVVAPSPQNMEFITVLNRRPIIHRDISAVVEAPVDLRFQSPVFENRSDRKAVERSAWDDEDASMHLEIVPDMKTSLRSRWKYVSSPGEWQKLIQVELELKNQNEYLTSLLRVHGLSSIPSRREDDVPVELRKAKYHLSVLEQRFQSLTSVFGQRLATKIGQ